MRFLAFLLFLGFIALTLFARWFVVCKVYHLCAEPVEEDIRLKTLKLTENDSIILLQGYDQFAFDSAAVQPRMNANNEAFLDTLAAMLRADTARSLTITGYYRPSEKDWKPERGFSENLGLARADAVRSLLNKRGIKAERIIPDYAESPDPDLKEPMTFSLFDPRLVPEGYDKPVYTFSNMTFSDANFAFDSEEFRPGVPCVLYADSVKTYLDLHSDKTLTIIGHTDSKGDTKYNYNLGLRRAKSAMQYFRELGVTVDIKTESKGEKEPVAPNAVKGKDNPEGRQKNRRVNFVIQ
ncbi:MAG: OmpA family protein [Lewinellaceae bacterium]|nr:OmpA family protein [Lewinella sp.]MCB9280265.1 OmpA family protein [Lewinellaceae bacterium]